VKAHIQKVTFSQQSSFVYRVKSDARFARGWHYHPEYELTYIQESGGRRLVGDNIDNYRSGDLVLLGPNLPHSWRSEIRAASSKRSTRSLHKAIVIQFQESFLGDGFLKSPELTRVAALLERATRGLHITGRTRDDVSGRMLAMKKLARFDRFLELLRILEILATSAREVRVISRTPCAPSPGARSQERFDRVFSFLHEKYTGPISQPEVAKLGRMSSSGFSRFFRRTTGKTFVEYLGELRISHACNLLIETDLSILQTSLQSGFNNLSNFNRKFLKLKGESPAAYRSQYAAAFD
jgi:AraC-like DNA-binding protein